MIFLVPKGHGGPAEIQIPLCFWYDLPRVRTHDHPHSWVDTISPPGWEEITPQNLYIDVYSQLTQMVYDWECISDLHGCGRASNGILIVPPHFVYHRAETAQPRPFYTPLHASGVQLWRSVLFKDATMINVACRIRTCDIWVRRLLCVSPLIEIEIGDMRRPYWGGGGGLWLGEIIKGLGSHGHLSSAAPAFVCPADMLQHHWTLYWFLPLLSDMEAGTPTLTGSVDIVRVGARWWRACYFHCSTFDWKLSFINLRGLE